MKKLFEPGQMVATFSGQAGMVISKRLLAILRKRSHEGKRPGHWQAEGDDKKQAEIQRQLDQLAAPNGAV
jgi:hypothetical protein